MKRFCRLITSEEVSESQKAKLPFRLKSRQDEHVTLQKQRFN